MSITNKKAYIYKMRLGPANILGILIFILLIIVTYLLGISIYVDMNLGLLFIAMIIYLCLHELLHGIGYIIGGCKRCNVSYGIALEKGIFYCMAYQELSKKNILISLQMPFMVIGVITYIIGVICNIPLLVVLSIINLIGASMDIMMFLYILKLEKNVIYSESGEPDQFVLISEDDLTKQKSLFFKVVDVKEYNSKDYIFKNINKIKISKTSLIIIGILLLCTLISML